MSIQFEGVVELVLPNARSGTSVLSNGKHATPMHLSMSVFHGMGQSKVLYIPTLGFMITNVLK